MPSPTDQHAFENLLRIAADEVEATSLRNVARHLGMSPTGLQKVLDGTRTLPGTRRKLERWYVRERLHTPDEPEDDAAFYAARVLVQGIPPGRQDDVLADVGAALAESFASAGEPRPAWLDRLLEAAPAPSEPTPEHSVEDE